MVDCAWSSGRVLGHYQQRTGYEKGEFRMAKKKADSEKKKKKKKREAKGAAKSYVRFSDKLTGSLEEIGRIIEDNKATMDSIQDMALELTRAAGVLQATASRYAGMVDSLLETAVPILRNIPLIPPRTMELITELQDLANTILDVCTKADKVITDVGDGLQSADIGKINAHTGDLQQMTKALHRVLPD
jgi:hypothetical protein